MNILTENNKINLVGKKVSVPQFHHAIYDENFYTFNMEVKRLSDVTDTIPVLISEKLMDDAFNDAEYISLEGQLRSYNKDEDNRRKLLVNVFTRKVTAVTEEECTACKNPNELTLRGFICKPPVFRTTPLNREIADLLIAVNRSYNKSDYIPVISWGRNAGYCGRLPVSTHVEIVGRFQSRVYNKNIDGVDHAMVAYEVSASRVKVLPQESESDAI